MHKMTRMGLGLALVVGAASAAAAQSTQPDTRPNATQPDHGGRKVSGASVACAAEAGQGVRCSRASR